MSYGNSKTKVLKHTPFPTSALPHHNGKHSSSEHNPKESQTSNDSSGGGGVLRRVWEGKERKGVGSGPQCLAMTFSESPEGLSHVS